MQEATQQASMMGYQQAQTQEMVYNPEMSIESAAAQIPPLYPVRLKLNLKLIKNIIFLLFSDFRCSAPRAEIRCFAAEVLI